MDASQVADYARRLREAHGEQAAYEAARKAAEYEKDGDAANAETWRRIEAALVERQGPHES